MALISALFFIVFLAGCGGQQANQDNENTRTVERTVIQTVEVTQEETIEEATQGTTEASASVDCSGFGDQMAAQQFYDFTATDTEQKVLDTDGNGLACDEPGAIEERNASGDTPLSQGDQENLNLANCQFAEAQSEMSPEEFQRFQDEITDELVIAIEQDIDTNIQTILLERGYDCDGQAQEILGQKKGRVP